MQAPKPYNCRLTFFSSFYYTFHYNELIPVRLVELLEGEEILAQEFFTDDLLQVTLPPAAMLLLAAVCGQTHR